MSKFSTQTVTHVHHWCEGLFSFRTTRDASLRFVNGQFVMLGLPPKSEHGEEARPLLRAYSVASPNYEEHLEFFSIKVPDGPLTSKLQHIKVGDEVIVSKKPTGSLVIDDLRPGKHLYLLGTGTGLAPFMSLVQDPEVYERFDKVVLVHCTRFVRELAYHEFLTQTLPNHEFLGEMVREKLIYYPTVTREAFKNQGRITDLMRSGKLFADIRLPPINAQDDRLMLCGSPALLKDSCTLIDSMGLTISPGIGQLGDYVIERAFVGV